MLAALPPSDKTELKIEQLPGRHFLFLWAESFVYLCFRRYAHLGNIDSNNTSFSIPVNSLIVIVIGQRLDRIQGVVI